MISGKNYFTITVVMLVVFFMFQFTNVVLEGWNGYEKNAYAQNRESLISQENAYQAGQKKAGSNIGDSRERIVYIGSADGALGKVVANWVNYTKRELDVYATVEDYRKETKKTLPEMLVLDTAHINWKDESVCKNLKECAYQGIDLVFGNLPDVSVIKETPKLRHILGIRGATADETTVEGIHLYDGLLLGGEIVYRSEDEKEIEKRQDMELTFPWYRLSPKVDVYMAGVPIGETEDMKIEDRPPIIWQNSVGDAQVFAVNGPYMEDVAGLGLLSAMSAKTKDYELYPVINAQNMVVLNWPGMAEEYGEELKEQYGQSMPGLFQDVIWPSVVSMYRRGTLGLTCMLTPQYDYEDDNSPIATELEFYMKRLKEQSAEAGLTGENMSNTSIGQKLYEDERFVEELLPDYKFTSFYAGKLTDAELDSVLQEDFLDAVRTVMKDYDGNSDIIGYQSDYITRQSILSDGVNYTYRDDFRMRSVETALGYANVGIDIGRAINPESSQDDVDRVLSDFSWNVRTYWAGYGTFAKTVASESDQRIRNFLALDYEERREGNTIYLDLKEECIPAWFILRTDKGKISRIDGGSWELVEQGAYLIKADRANVVIEF